MICISGNGGGSDDKKILKFGWDVKNVCSINPSKPFIPFNHVCIKCRFWSIIQWPFYAQLKSAFLAGSSCPWPIEILINFPLVMEIPNLAAALSTSGVGSTPGKSTKNIGVLLSVSSND